MIVAFGAITGLIAAALTLMASAVIFLSSSVRQVRRPLSTILLWHGALIGSAVLMALALAGSILMFISFVPLVGAGVGFTEVFSFSTEIPIVVVLLAGICLHLFFIGFRRAGGRIAGLSAGGTSSQVKGGGIQRSPLKASNGVSSAYSSPDTVSGGGGNSRLLRSIAGADTYRHSICGGVPVRFVRSDRAFALAATGREPFILASSRLEELLTEGQLSAVLEHECAHVHQRHDLALRTSKVLNRLIPLSRWGTTGTGAGAAIPLMLELAADDRAAARCGRSTLAAALELIAHAENDAGMALRARRLVAT